MVRAAVATNQLGDLPSLCVKTGEPTTRTRRQEFADIPGWTLWLLFWGLIPFLIAAGFSRRKVSADLPVSEETLRRVRNVDVGSITGLILGIVILVAAWLADSNQLFWIAVTLALITLVVGALSRRIVWVSGRLDGDVLWLYGVHPAFAEQVRGMRPGDGGAEVTANRVSYWLLVAALLVLALVLFFGSTTQS